MLGDDRGALGVARRRDRRVDGDDHGRAEARLSQARRLLAQGVRIPKAAARVYMVAARVYMVAARVHTVAALPLLLSLKACGTLADQLGAADRPLDLLVLTQGMATLQKHTPVPETLTPNPNP
eukprot:scaffold76332_cov54-Phaeocystis_antarctica.AAC.1